MKIIDLTFQNLNSIAGDPVHIDFGSGALAEAGIFAITGPTGAGKTTILDAITLALFGKAARYETGKPENMMSRGTGECFAEVRFSVSGEAYTARWDLTRARKKAGGKIQPVKRQLTDATGTILETKVRPVDEKITELTGMDYPRFLRSVLLAQGRFKEFLDAGEKERGDLLERITGTEIYSRLSRLAFEAAKKREETLADARQAVAMRVLLSEEEKAGLASKKAQLATQKEALQWALTALSERLILHTQWRDGQAKKVQLEQENRAIAKTGEDLTPDRVRLTRHEKAAPLESNLRLWESACAVINGLETDETQRHKTLDDAEGAAAEAFQQTRASCARQLKETAAHMGKKNETRGDLEARLATIEAWQDDHASDEQLEAALPGIRSQLGATTQKKDRVRAAIEAETVTRQGVTAQQEALALSKKMLCEAETACTTAEDGLKAIEKALAPHAPAAELTHRKEALETRQREISELSQISADHAAGTATVTTLETEQKESEGARATLAKEASDTTTALDLAKKALADKETIHQQALLIESLADKRAHLAEGEACPLCGALDHPYATGTTGPQSRTCEAQRDQAKEHLRSCETADKDLAGQMAMEASHLSGISASLKIKRADLQGYAQRYAALLKGLAIEIAITDAEGLATRDAEIQAQLTALDATLKAIEALEKRRTTAERAMLEARGEVAAQGAKNQQINQDLERLNHQLSGQIDARKILETEFANALDEAFQKLAVWGISAPKRADLSSIAEAVTALETRTATWAAQTKSRLTETATLEKIRSEIETLTRQINQLREEETLWQEKGAPFEARMGTPPLKPFAPLDPTARRELCEKALAQVAHISTQLTSVKEQLQTKRAEEVEQHEALRKALTQRGFPEISALKEALLTPDIRASITTRIEAHNEKVTRFSTLASENQESLDSLAQKQPPTDEEVPELTREKGEKEDNRDEGLKQIGEIDHTRAPGASHTDRAN